MSSTLVDCLSKCAGQRHAAYLDALREADRQLMAMIEKILQRPAAARAAVKQFYPTRPAMPITGLRILPPFAIGRFGSSPTPLRRSI